MRNKIKGVCIRVHPLFFDNILEKNRKILEKRFNKPLTQIEFTGIMANNGMNIQLNKMSPKFAPRKLKKMRFFLL